MYCSQRIIPWWHTGGKGISPVSGFIRSFQQGETMYLHELTVQGYKCFLSPFKITFSKGLNVIVGENASGKTAIIDTIRLLLQEDEFGRSPISDTDFHRPFNKPTDQTGSFRLRGNFSELSPKETVAYLPWTDLDGQATLTLLARRLRRLNGSCRRRLNGSCRDY